MFCQCSRCTISNTAAYDTASPYLSADISCRRFYESTLGVQANFAPARERLHAIRCDKVLSNPHIYKPRPEK